MKLRFSLQSLLGTMTFLAVACAALASANEWWLSIVVTSSVAAGLTLLVVAVNGRDAARAGAIGALIFGGGYLLLAFAPWFQSNTAPWLLTTKLLVQAEARWKPTPAPGVTVWTGPVMLPANINTIYSSSTIPVYSTLASGTQPALSHFLLLGHWLCSWILAGVGAQWGIWAGAKGKPQAPQH